MPLILIVDDDAGMRDVLEKWFRSAGYDVIVAANGLEAVGHVRSDAGKIDLVISDFNMPVMNGAEAIRRIHETRPDVRFICMTGYSDIDLPPAVTLVSKPFKLSDMLRIARKVLSHETIKI